MTVGENVVRDARHAVRLLFKAPGFTFAAIITLGLGIGANTAIFSLVKAVLLEPLPYRAPDDLVLIWNPAEPRGTTHLSVREVVSYRRRRQEFRADCRLYRDERQPHRRTRSQRVRAGMVTVNLFDTLGVAPMRGRAFHAAEGQPGAPDVVMVSQGLWQRRFGGAADLIGREIRVNGRVRMVVGIMPDSFRLPLDYRADRPTEVWLPLVIDRANLGAWGDRSYFGVARLKAGMTPEPASSELAVITERWRSAGLKASRAEARSAAMPFPCVN